EAERSSVTGGPFSSPASADALLCGENLTRAGRAIGLAVAQLSLGFSFRSRRLVSRTGLTELKFCERVYSIHFPFGRSSATLRNFAGLSRDVRYAGVRADVAALYNRDMRKWRNWQTHQT